MFEYLHRTLEEGDDINGWLNNRGQEGWRLHTFDQLSHTGTIPTYYVVMDRYHPNTEQAEAPGGMAMRG